MTPETLQFFAVIFSGSTLVLVLKLSYHAGKFANRLEEAEKDIHKLRRDVDHLKSHPAQKALEQFEQKAQAAHGGIR